jgi:hypothetical protein
MRRLARFRHHHVIAAHQNHIVVIQQMVTNQHPLQPVPAHVGMEKTLDRPVTAALTRPAGKPPHRHSTGHRQHRFGNPTKLA